MFKKFYEAINKIIAENNEQGNAYSINRYLYKAIQIDESKIIAQEKPKVITEGIEFAPSAEEQGGMIVFSTEVNAVKQADNAIVDWFKKKIKSIKNKFSANKVIGSIAQKHDLVGWTIGRGFKGCYTGRNNKLYDENSLTVEIVGISSEELIKIAEEVCRAFDQESVMVKDYANKKVLFVNGE